MSLPTRTRKNGLWMAAKTSSVSYRGELTPEVLAHALATGVVPREFQSHLGHFMEEAPMEVVVLAIEEAAMLASMSPVAVWENVVAMATTLESHRRPWEEPWSALDRNFPQRPGRKGLWL